MAGYGGMNVGSGTMVYLPILEEGVFRFDCFSSHGKIASSPSISFENPLEDINIAPSYIPTYEFEKGQQIVNIKLPPNTSFYGTGEVSGPLERTGKKIVTWNTDAYGYGADNISLYQSHPWVLAVLENGKAIGVLADTTRRCEIDLQEKSNIKLISSSPYPVITFGPFASPTDVLSSFSRAVGANFMPPKWALGYQQSRWSYYTAQEVHKIAMKFRKKNIPCDAIWMDIDYMDGFKCFTFDKERFPDPKSLADSLHQIGFKALWMLDPGIKKDKGYSVYDSGTEGYMWTQAADGKPFVGKVWPGPCVFPDFTQSRVRSWWADLVKEFISNGVDGLWNDMNEPAVMEIEGKTMPDSNVHWGDVHLGGPQKHSHYHNVYGLLMAKSTHKGMKLANEHKRPFVLTRAGFVGSQRYAATWTGDNTSSWEHLRMSIPMVLNLGLSGQPFSGPDIGGFIGNATPKLFGRWMGIGSMLPFCRGHSAEETERHEPWSFGIEVEKICRLALQRRYRILPLLYTLFYLAHTKGVPVATPTFFADPTDLKLRSQENSFMLGPLLIYASTEENKDTAQIIDPELPKGIWRCFDFEDFHPELPMLYLKGGSIIPVAPPHQHVGEANPTDDLTLIVCLDEHGKAEGVLFEDDGDGYEYTKGGYLLTTYVATLGCSVVTIKVSKVEGSWPRPERRLHVIVLGFSKKIGAWGTDGKEVQVSLCDNECGYTDPEDEGCDSDEEDDPEDEGCDSDEEDEPFTVKHKL